MTTTTERFELEVPARPEHIATARIFIGALGRRLGLDEERVADVKLALSEAATLAVAGGVSVMRVVAVAGVEGLEIEVGPLDPQEEDIDPDLPGGLDLITALFPGSGPGSAGDTAVIRVGLGS